MFLRPTLAVLILLALGFACKKAVDKQAPLITTLSPISTGELSIAASGRVYEQGGDEITECGFCWSTKSDPTLEDDHVVATLSAAVFNATISNLDAFVTYNVRAYAINKYGTTYGRTEQVNTGPAPTPPLLGNTILERLGLNTCTISAGVTSSAKKLTSVGICWNTTGNPTIADNTSTLIATPNNAFTCTVKNLPENTIIFARPFAANAAGLSYGNLIILKTYYGTMTDGQGNWYYTTLINGKEWMAENLRTRQFRSGAVIPLIKGDYEWYTNSGLAACSLTEYASDEFDSHGLLYNFGAISSASGLAPAGWHVPTKAEFDQLLASFDSGQPAIFCLRHPVQNTIFNTGYPDKLTAFDATFDGARDYSGGYFGTFVTSYFACSTLYQNYYYYALIMGNNYSPYMSYFDKQTAVAVRLVKD